MLLFRSCLHCGGLAKRNRVLNPENSLLPPDFQSLLRNPGFIPVASRQAHISFVRRLQSLAGLDSDAQ